MPAVQSDGAATGDRAGPGPGGGLVSVVYVSTAVRPFGRRELLSLLRDARARNAAAGITGMLLYRSGNFIQALEGPPAAVDALLGRIARDGRHAGMILVLRRTVATREFAGWSMGFDDLSRHDLAGEPGFSDFLRRVEAGKASDADSGIAMALLRRFARNNR